MLLTDIKPIRISNNTNIPYEFSIDINKSTYYVIYGNIDDFKYYCCIPNLRFSCILSEPTSIDYNLGQLMITGRLSVNISIQITKAILHVYLSQDSKHFDKLDNIIKMQNDLCKNEYSYLLQNFCLSASIDHNILLNYFNDKCDDEEKEFHKIIIDCTSLLENYFFTKFFLVIETSKELYFFGYNCNSLLDVKFILKTDLEIFIKNFNPTIEDFIENNSELTAYFKPTHVDYKDMLIKNCIQ